MVYVSLKNLELTDLDVIIIMSNSCLCTKDYSCSLIHPSSTCGGSHLIWLISFIQKHIALLIIHTSQMQWQKKVWLFLSLHDQVKMVDPKLRHYSLMFALRYLPTTLSASSCRGGESLVRPELGCKVTLVFVELKLTRALSLTTAGECHDLVRSWSQSLLLMSLCLSNVSEL